MTKYNSNLIVPLILLFCGANSHSEEVSKGLLVQQLKLYEECLDNYEYVSDGSQFVIYTPDKKQARIMTNDPFNQFLGFDNAFSRITRQHLFPHSTDTTISDFVDSASDVNFSKLATEIVCYVTEARESDPTRYDGIRLFIKTEPHLSIEKYELFFGVVNNGVKTERIEQTCRFSQFKEIEPGIWMPFFAQWDETKYTQTIENPISYPFLRHTIIIKDIYDYDAKANGSIKLDLPSGTFLSDDITGTTYQIKDSKTVPSLIGKNPPDK